MTESHIPKPLLGESEGACEWGECEAPTVNREGVRYRKEIGEATAFIKGWTSYRPTIGIILGSGLGSLADEVIEADIIPYSEIPHFPRATVEGHRGELAIGRFGNKEVIVMRGRAHFYEGYSLARVTFPIRVMRALGVRILIVTNAAGGLSPSFRAGDLMLITDHINLVGMAGFNPLYGPKDESLGPRFLDMSQAYDLHLQEIAREVAKELGFGLRQGVYIMLAGPTYETPAELRFIRMIGADAVGMSTVPEVIVARHGGMRALGLSAISNVALGSHTGQGDESPRLKGALLEGGQGNSPGVSHEEVLAATEAMMPKLIALIKGIVQRITGPSP